MTRQCWGGTGGWVLLECEFEYFFKVVYFFIILNHNVYCRMNLFVHIVDEKLIDF